MKTLACILFFGISALRLSAQTTFSCSSSSTVCACTSGSVRAEFYSSYFSDVQTFFSLNIPSLTRYDATINYTTDNGWGSIVPPATGSTTDPNAFSTRWSGAIYLAAGSYTFWLTSDDASWLWLGVNSLLANPTSTNAFINNGGLHSAATVSSVGIFTANCLQDFKLHYGENTGNNRCILEYACTSLGIARQAIPSSAFCPCTSNFVLPIELKEFYGKANKDNVTLYWSTATEKDNQLFTVFKSRDGINWSVLGEQTGAGTSSSTRKYTLADTDPLFGTNYYYLTQTDKDGEVKKFEVVSVDFSNSDSYIKIFPNPFQDRFTVTSSTAWTDADTFALYDSFGKQVTLQVSHADSYTAVLNTEGLPKGSYILKIHSAYQVIVKKLMKS